MALNRPPHIKATTLRAAIVAVTTICVTPPGAAAAQSLTIESAVTAGTSTEDVSAAATQFRGFGDVTSDVRFFVEGAWAHRTEEETDVFGAAYPYSGRMQVIEAYGERMFRPRGAVLGIRVGRYRTPFGISNGSDHGYTGFLRAPLIRYDDYYALSNSFLERGADVVAGVPRLTVEASVGRPDDVGEAVRRPGLDTVIRVQSFAGQFIVGVSHIHTRPYLPASFAKGWAVFTGVDVRWMHDGVQLRGEWTTGRPFDGTTTTGWYADAIVHRVAMGPITAVARVEQLDYNTVSVFALHAHRQTLGARIRVLDGLSAQVNLVHQTGRLPQRRPTALDVGVTYSIRRDFRHD